MGSLIPAYSLSNVFRQIENFAEKRIDESILVLARVGEEFVNNARECGDYTDITGNLRSSIGYVILWNGDIRQKRIEEAGVGNDQKTGVMRARELADQFANDFPNELVLIGFAGMGYAAAVESRGLDVITGSVPMAEELLNELKEELGAI